MIELILSVGKGIESLGIGILLLGMVDERVLGTNGICILRGHQVLVLLKIPDIKYFMRYACVRGHCHVRVRTAS